MAKKTKTQEFDPSEAFDRLEHIAKEYLDVLRITQQEETKRERIRARGAVELEKIRTKKELWLRYLDLTFDERRGNFDKLFESLDRAAETGNVDLAQGTLHTILELAKSSPFKFLSAADASRMLKDPDAEFEVEF